MYCIMEFNQASIDFAFDVKLVVMLDVLRSTYPEMLTEDNGGAHHLKYLREIVVEDMQKKRRELLIWVDERPLFDITEYIQFVYRKFEHIASTKLCAEKRVVEKYFGVDRIQAIASRAQTARQANLNQQQSIQCNQQPQSQQTPQNQRLQQQYSQNQQLPQQTPQNQQLQQAAHMKQYSQHPPADLQQRQSPQQQSQPVPSYQMLKEMLQRKSQEPNFPQFQQQTLSYSPQPQVQSQSQPQANQLAQAQHQQQPHQQHVHSQPSNSPIYQQQMPPVKSQQTNFQSVLPPYPQTRFNTQAPAHQFPVRFDAAPQVAQQQNQLLPFPSTNSSSTMIHQNVTNYPATQTMSYSPVSLAAPSQIRTNTCLVAHNNQQQQVQNIRMQNVHQQTQINQTVQLQNTLASINFTATAQNCLINVTTQPAPAQQPHILQQPIHHQQEPQQLQLQQQQQRQQQQIGTIPAQRTPPIDSSTNRESALSRPKLPSPINTAANPNESSTHNNNGTRKLISFSQQTDLVEKINDSFAEGDILVSTKMMSFLAQSNRSESIGSKNQVKLSATSPSEQPKLKVRDFAKELETNQSPGETDKSPLKRKSNSLDEQTTAEKQIQLSYVIGNDCISETVKLPNMPSLDNPNDALGNPRANDESRPESRAREGGENFVPPAKKVAIEAKRNDLSANILPEEIALSAEKTIPDKETSLDESMMDSGVESETALSPKESYNATVSVSSASPENNEEESTERQTGTPPQAKESSEQPIANRTHEENNLLLDVMEKMSEDSDCDRLVIDEEPCGDFGAFVRTFPSLSCIITC